MCDQWCRRVGCGLWVRKGKGYNRVCAASAMASQNRKKCNFDLFHINGKFRNGFKLVVTVSLLTFFSEACEKLSV